MLVTALLLLATPTAATPDKAAPNPDRLICKSQLEASSRIPARVCKTLAAWKQDEADAQKDWRDADRQRHSSDPNGY